MENSFGEYALVAAARIMEHTVGRDEMAQIQANDGTLFQLLQDGTVRISNLRDQHYEEVVGVPDGGRRLVQPITRTRFQRTRARMWEAWHRANVRWGDID